MRPHKKDSPCAVSYMCSLRCVLRVPVRVFAPSAVSWACSSCCVLGVLVSCPCPRGCVSRFVSVVTCSLGFPLVSTHRPPLTQVL